MMLEESVVLGARQLNWFVAPYSRSLIKPTPEFPKIIIKSPNAENWLAYGTDPTNEHFQSVEFMRWIPGKSKFEFTLIERNANNGKLTVDRSGAKCIECHTSRLRPIWDSYKAWPGLAPARDDLLETDPRNPSKLEPLSSYYLSFLEKIQQSRPAEDRLAALASPFGPMSVSQIKENELKNGYLRIPHFPDPQYNLNFSKKTAKLAGPSHLAFDQLETLNLCSAADAIRKKSLDSKLLSQLAIASAWKSTAQPNQQSACDQLGAGKDCTPTINSNIQFKQLADQENIDDRIAKQKSTYLSLVDFGMKIDESDIQFWTKTAKRSLPAGLSVIADPGGVLPVAEADPTTIAAFQYILKDTGIKVQDWSMSDMPVVPLSHSNGRMSFSDQFASILMKIDWKSFEVPRREAVLLDLGNSILGTKDNLDLTVIQIRDEQFSEFGPLGERLARSILIPDPNNALDNPLFALKVVGNTGVNLRTWLKNHSTAQSNGLSAESNIICNQTSSCYVLLAKTDIEEFRDSRRLGQVLK
jgi:hypothetical protein